MKVLKNQSGRKRKQPVSSSGPANSTGTANTAGPSPSSAPSTPSTHTPGDVISMPNLPHSGGSSKAMVLYGSDGTGTTLTSPSNQLVCFFKLLMGVHRSFRSQYELSSIDFWLFCRLIWIDLWKRARLTTTLSLFCPMRMVINGISLGGVWMLVKVSVFSPTQHYSTIKR